MKKNNKKKKLPRYWLGTRKPTSLGYLPSYGIGNAQFTSVQGEDITPETKAAKANLIPGAINKLQQSVTPTMSALNNMKTVAPTAAANAAVNAGVVNTINTMPDAIAAMPATQNLYAAAKAGAFKAAPTKVLGTAGTAASVAGTIYGGIDLANQFAHEGDHRTAGDMRNTLATNTYTTAGGNQYTEYGGVNTKAELDYEKAQRTAKRLNLATTAATTGFSGGLALAGILGTSNPIGWGLAGLGALGVGLGILPDFFGFGDNEDEVRQQWRDLSDITSMLNRQSRSAALSQDTKDSFYGNAANGKQPNARVSNGEVVGNFEDGYAYRVPGQKNNNDTVKTHLNKEDFVISNKFGLSDYAAATGDYVGALNMQDMLMNLYKNKYKCGKLPKFANGFWGNLGEYALATLPHFGSYLTNLSQYNRAKHADTYVPQMEINNPQTSAAINQVMSDMIDPREYMNQSNSDYRQALWNIQRMPGMGLGARAMMADSLNRAKFANDTATRMKIDEANRAQRNVGAQMREKLGHELTTKRYDQFWRRWGAAQQANAAKENWMAQYLMNRDMSLINGAADLSRVNQYNKALGIQDKMLNIYQQNADTERIKALTGLNNPVITPADTVSNYNEWWNSLDWAQKNAILGRAARQARNNVIL